MERSLDREMFDAYLTVLETVNPEDASRLEAAYEASNSKADDEEIADQIVEALEEAGLPIEPA
jgi:hypothetical protein